MSPAGGRWTRALRAAPTGPRSRADRATAETRRVRARRPLSRELRFALACAACLLVAAGYVAWTMRRAEVRTRGTTEVTGTGDTAAVSIVVGSPEALAALAGTPHLVFRNTAPGGAAGRLALAPLDAPDGPRTVTSLRCDRVYLAAGQGLCLSGVAGVVNTGSVTVFDADFRPRHRLPLAGIPSRARVSPDGRYGAITVFVSGHSYAAGSFSTQTTLIDMAGGEPLADLERFAVWRDGVRIQAPDYNFWGVTFARDSDRFYATLATGGRTYLVEGRVAARELHVLHENVECPSLSPDNTRVAYKKLVGTEGNRTIWRPTVLDLATMTETPLAGEAHSVDDQIEWLDDSHILYAIEADAPRSAGAVPADIWVLGADGSDTPRRLLPQGSSPAVVR